MAVRINLFSTNEVMNPRMIHCVYPPYVIICLTVSINAAICNICKVEVSDQLRSGDGLVCCDMRRSVTVIYLPLLFCFSFRCVCGEAGLGCWRGFFKYSFGIFNKTVMMSDN